MLVSLRIDRFRSHQGSTLPLEALTVMIGANASGKSNALEALSLLGWLATGRRLGELVYAMRDGELPIRGVPRDLAPVGQEATVEFVATFHEPSAGAWESELRRLLLRLTLRVDDHELRVVHESLEATYAPGGLPLYWTESPALAGGAEMSIGYNNFARGGKKPKVPVVDQQPVFTQLTTPARLASANHKESARLIPAACRHVQESLLGVMVLDAVPGRMRDYSFPTETRLQRDGRNVSAVLFSLCEAGHRAHILDFVRALPEQDLLALDFVRTPRGEVMVQLEESFGDSRRAVDAASLSDGTLRVLAIAAALWSAPLGGILVVEEIDNGVHPSRVADLLRRMEEVARDRRLRVLATTHSPALLDALSPVALGDVVVCYRQPSGSSALISLQRIARLPSLLAQGSLGQLVTRRVLDRFLPGREAPAVSAAAWMESLGLGGAS